MESRGMILSYFLSMVQDVSDNMGGYWIYLKDGERWIVNETLLTKGRKRRNSEWKRKSQDELLWTNQLLMLSRLTLRSSKSIEWRKENQYEGLMVVDGIIPVEFIYLNYGKRMRRFRRRCGKGSTLNGSDRVNMSYYGLLKLLSIVDEVIQVGQVDQRGQIWGMYCFRWNNTSWMIPFERWPMNGKLWIRGSKMSKFEWTRARQWDYLNLCCSNTYWAGHLDWVWWKEALCPFLMAVDEFKRSLWK